MCGRYTLISASNLFDRFSADGPSGTGYEITPSNKIEDYNVAPGRIMPVVTRNSPNKIVMMKWGLIPFWAKDPKIGYKMINARSESVAEKPSFRTPFKKQRCLVPASGFYEWKKAGSNTKSSKNTKVKIPYYIKLKNQELFAFAGLYDVWKDAEGKEVLTYTIITTGPNDLMQDIHDRMPVIIPLSEESKWLDSTTSGEELLSMLTPIPSDKMEAYVVSPKVNSPKNNSEELIKRI